MTREEAISRQAVLEMAYDMSEIDGEHFTKPWMVVDVEDIQKLPSVKPQEPILDKIRAEIDDLDTHYDNDYFVGNKDAMFKCDEVMQIIDKYRGEVDCRECKAEYECYECEKYAESEGE